MNYNKLWFTALDFNEVTELLAAPHFDGVPEKVTVTNSEDITYTHSDFDDKLDDDAHDELQPAPATGEEEPAGIYSASHWKSIPVSSHLLAAEMQKQ